MIYHVAKTSGSPKLIWGHRYTNLREAMVAAEILSADAGEPYSIFEVTPIITISSEPLEKTNETQASEGNRNSPIEARHQHR